MLISANWLSEYVDHGLSADELAEKLTMSGLEVEGVERIGFTGDGVVVGKVLDVREHPDADRLSLCTVDVSGDEALPIVCGAPNVAAGQLVAVATVGTELMLPSRDNPEERSPVTIRKAKIRGEVSRGMICAEDELGLGSGHEGILVLDEDAQPGQPLTDYLADRGIPAGDHVIDIAITPNRPDAISHIGVARDIAALLDTPLKRPEVSIPEPGGETASRVSIAIEDPDGCTRYVGILVEDVEIRESPDWMKRRLEAIGLRPRNVIVDITNYVLHECGQPLHAFDYDQVAGSSIVVRSLGEKLKFTTLDDKERDLPAGTLMICDGDREVAVAGVMGGQNSEVSDTTTNVLIESAWFDPSSIRRTARELGIQTDASYRFERGVDPTGQAWAAARAAELMAELAGGSIVDGMVDAHPRPYEGAVLQLRSKRIAALLGVEVPPAESERLLRAIGFNVERTGGPDIEPVWDVTVPGHRPDVEREVDLIEEVARLYGYDRIPEPTHSRVPNFTPEISPTRMLRSRGRSLLEGLGFREIYTNSMLSKDLAEKYHRPSLPAGRPGGDVVETLNPITTEMSTLRPSLLPGALRVAAHNQNHGRTDLRLFEFGRVHVRKETDRTVVGDYTEIESLMILIGGDFEPAGWSTAPRAADVYDLKGVAGRVLASLGAADLRFEPASADFAADRLDVLTADDTWIGTVGRVRPDDAPDVDLRSDVYFAEIDFGAVVSTSAAALRPRYEAVSRFPVVDRDIAVVVDADVPVGQMLRQVRASGDELLLDAGVFDLYQGKGVPDGKKSIAFSLRFGSDRTLRDKEVDGSVSAILKLLKEQFSAVLR